MQVVMITAYYMDNFFNHFTLGQTSLDVRENRDSYEYEFNLAGFKKKNIKASVLNSIATINAKQGEKEFYRRFYLPKDSDLKSTNLRYEDGVLYLKINKKESAKKVELKIQ
jgi:HSP20 family molecular chaperone IbpA